MSYISSQEILSKNSSQTHLYLNPSPKTTSSLQLEPLLCPNYFPFTSQQRRVIERNSEKDLGKLNYSSEAMNTFIAAFPCMKIWKLSVEDFWGKTALSHGS